jgi:phage gp46-like protein
MDLRIVETMNGGDLIRAGNDLEMVGSFQNMPYLALFGGNVKQSTPNQRLFTEQAFDWWGNSLLLFDDIGIQFNSETERTLQSVGLSSASRQIIQDAVNADLQFMQAFAIIVVEVSIIATDVVKIFISLKEPDNLQAQEFIYIWNAALQELVVDYDVNNNPIPLTQPELQSLLQIRL